MWSLNKRMPVTPDVAIKVITDQEQNIGGIRSRTLTDAEDNQESCQRGDSKTSQGLQ
jgi:hypothetical protein